MNPTITLLLYADDQILLTGVETMLPSSGRPLFEEDVEPKWFDLYKSIELLEPTSALKRIGHLILLEWNETNHAVVTLKNTFVKIGFTVKFIHAIEGDPAAADQYSSEDDFNGQYLFNVDGELKHLSRANVKVLLSNYPNAWVDDFEENVPKLTEHLMR
jgi:hypothetical protein